MERKFWVAFVLEVGLCMWYERNCGSILLMTACCGCSIWACWQLRENTSTVRSSCTRFFSDSTLERPCSFFLFFVLLLSSSRTVWRTSRQVLLIHWEFHLEPVFEIWLALIFCEKWQQFRIFFLGSLVINWIHVRFILRPLRRALVLVIYAIHIFIINCLNLFVNLKCIFTRLPTSNEEWSTNEISCAEELNRISALVPLRMDPYP